MLLQGDPRFVFVDLAIPMGGKEPTMGVDQSVRIKARDKSCVLQGLQINVTSGRAAF